MAPNVNHVFHQYTVRVGGFNRDKLMEFLKSMGIGTGIHYPKPIYQQKIYQERGFDSFCQEAESASLEVLSLPVHPSLDKSELDEIVSALKEASKSF